MSDSPVNINLILSPRQSGWPFWLASSLLHALPLGILSIYEGPHSSPGSEQTLVVEMVYTTPAATPNQCLQNPQKKVSKVNPAEEQASIQNQAPTSSGSTTELDGVSAYADNPIPGYPEAARTQAIEGKVILALTINAHGQVCRVKPCPPLTHPLLEEAVIATVKKWRFKTTGLTGEHTIVQEFCFKLTDSQ